MSLAQFALKRPYTIIASLMLVCIMGIGAGLRMPVDIFPEIDIPVVSVVWTYAGMSPRAREYSFNSYLRMVVTMGSTSPRAFV
jgi:multidrug efflux pump subunit AcrB